MPDLVAASPLRTTTAEAACSIVSGDGGRDRRRRSPLPAVADPSGVTGDARLTDGLKEGIRG